MDDHVVTLDLGGGRRLHMDPDDARAQMLLSTAGEFNSGSKELWRRLAASRSWDLVIDVGANYGEMLLELPRGTGATVVAFEANTALLPYLRRTVEDSGLAVTLVGEAVSDVVGATHLLVDSQWSGQSRLASTPGDSSGLVDTPVTSTTLDAFFLHDHAAHICVKVDVEGAERSVLDGGRSLFADAEDVAVMLEILHMEPREIAELAGEWRMFVMDLRTAELIRVTPDAERVTDLLSSGWCYPQDAIIVPRGGKGRRPW